MRPSKGACSRRARPRARYFLALAAVDRGRDDVVGAAGDEEQGGGLVRASGRAWRRARRGRPAWTRARARRIVMRVHLRGRRGVVERVAPLRLAHEERPGAEEEREVRPQHRPARAPGRPWAAPSRWRRRWRAEPAVEEQLHDEPAPIEWPISTGGDGCCLATNRSPRPALSSVSLPSAASGWRARSSAGAPSWCGQAGASHRMPRALKRSIQPCQQRGVTGMPWMKITDVIVLPAPSGYDFGCCINQIEYMIPPIGQTRAPARAGRRGSSTARRRRRVHAYAAAVPVSLPARSAVDVVGHRRCRCRSPVQPFLAAHDADRLHGRRHRGPSPS